MSRSRDSIECHLQDKPGERGSSAAVPVCGAQQHKDPREDAENRVAAGAILPHNDNRGLSCPGAVASPPGTAPGRDNQVPVGVARVLGTGGPVSDGKVEHQLEHVPGQHQGLHRGRNRWPGI